MRQRGSLLLLVFGSVVVSDIFLQSYFRGVDIGVANSGIFLGLLPSISLTVLLVLYFSLLFWFIKETSAGRLSFGVFCILLGGLGNLLPRLATGTIWDYIYLPFVPFRFNLSDILISWGVISYILGTDGDFNIIRRLRHSGNQ